MFNLKYVKVEKNEVTGQQEFIFAKEIRFVEINGEVYFPASEMRKVLQGLPAMLNYFAQFSKDSDCKDLKVFPYTGHVYYTKKGVKKLFEYFSEHLQKGEQIKYLNLLFKKIETVKKTDDFVDHIAEREFSISKVKVENTIINVVWIVRACRFLGYAAPGKDIYALRAESGLLENEDFFVKKRAELEKDELIFTGYYKRAQEDCVCLTRSGVVKLAACLISRGHNPKRINSLAVQLCDMLTYGGEFGKTDDSAVLKEIKDNSRTFLSEKEIPISTEARTKINKVLKTEVKKDMIETIMSYPKSKFTTLSFATLIGVTKEKVLEALRAYHAIENVEGMYIPTAAAVEKGLLTIDIRFADEMFLIEKSFAAILSRSIIKVAVSMDDAV